MEDLSKMRELCDVLGLDLLQKIRDEVDESVGDINSWVTSGLSVETIHRLKRCVEGLYKLKVDIFAEIKKKAVVIVSYCNALLVPFEKKQEVMTVVYYVQAESEDEITEAKALSLEFVKKVEEEYHKLREKIYSLILKKKSKLLQILKATHLTSSFVNTDITDPGSALLDIKKQIYEAKNLASRRASTVAKLELIQYACEVRTMLRALPKMLRDVEVELTSWAEPFIYNDEDALEILKTATAKLIDATSTENAKLIDATSTEKASTSTVKPPNASNRLTCAVLRGCLS